jgi:hypothetical protein
MNEVPFFRKWGVASEQGLPTRFPRKNTTLTGSHPRIYFASQLSAEMGTHLTDLRCAPNMPFC